MTGVSCTLRVMFQCLFNGMKNGKNEIEIDGTQTYKRKREK